MYHLFPIRVLRRFARLFKKTAIRLSTPIEAYEDAFHEAMKKTIQRGDTVWDVGANVGLYTTLFAKWAGAEGKVFAFEPLPAALAALRESIAKIGAETDTANIVVHAAALSDKSGFEEFEVTEEAHQVTTTSRLVTGSQEIDLKTVEVKVQTVDELCFGGGFAIPTVLKIDVEGFEDDVLAGGRETFASRDCRDLFVEVHFTRLRERKRGSAPAKIVRLLKNWGYHVRWIDSSHLHATRV
jgi:FkbM family methyltransferase